MNSYFLLKAMNGIDSSHILSAQKKLGYDAPPRRTLPLRRILALAAAAAVLLSVCFVTALAVSPELRELVFVMLGIEVPAVLPDPTGETLSVTPEKPQAGGVLEGTYVHMPTASHAGNGVFLVNTDEFPMNSGNHYDAYYEQDGELVKLEKRSFSQDYTLLGTAFHVEFEWAEHQGKAILTYKDPDAPYIVVGTTGTVTAALVRFSCRVGEDWTEYPALIDLETGVLTDVLQGTGAETLTGIGNAAISGDLSKMLLACTDGSLYYADLTGKTLTPVDADACSLLGDTLVCWTLEGADIETAQLGRYRAWTLDLATMEEKEIFSSIPATGATSTDVWNQTYDVFFDAPDAWAQFGWVELPPVSHVGLHFLNGFDLSHHSGYQYTGSCFALEVREDRSVWVIDLTNGEKSVIEGFLWPEKIHPDIECIPSPDGRKLLICSWEEGVYGETGVVDFDRKIYITLSRENLKGVSEQRIGWFDNNSILISANSTGTPRDYYIYRLLK